MPPGALAPLPPLIGVIHLRALPGAPHADSDIGAIAASCARDAQTLAEAGFDGMIIENYGDAPFEPKKVAPITRSVLIPISDAAVGFWATACRSNTFGSMKWRSPRVTGDLSWRCPRLPSGS